MKYEFVSNNIRVKKYREEDADRLFEAVRESLEHLSPWMPWCHPEYCVEEAAEWIKFCEAAWDAKVEYNFLIENAASGDFIGTAGLNNFDALNKRANLGYWIRKSRLGNGIAAEAARMLIELGFAELGLCRVEIVVAVGNHASRRAAEKIGAVKECVARNRLFLHGKPRDAIIYSIVPQGII